MTFSKEDLDFVRQWIAQKGTKDSDFDPVSTLQGDEWFTLVKGSKNWKISAALLKHIFSLGDVQTLGGIQVVESVDDLASIVAKSYGNLVYVKDIDSYYSWSATEQWHQVTKVYVGHEEPKDKSVLWIDEDDETTLNYEENEEIATIKAAINKLIANQNSLLKLIKYGIVPGDSTNSVRMDGNEGVTPIEPVIDDDGNLVDGDASEGLEPDTSEYDHTVPSVNAKLDTSINFGKNKANLTDGELIFYTDRKQFKVYYQGSFFGSSDPSSGSGGGISVDDLYNTDLEYLVFTDGDNNYKVCFASDGDFICRKYSRENTPIGSKLGTWNVYISQFLSINTVFCGGDGSEDCSCSHNFVEIANGSDSDINLKGIMLLYSDCSAASEGQGYTWKTLALEGVIKAHSTFLVRGARCNTSKQSFIRVDKCDMEWYDGSSLIRFNQGPASFYLAVGNTAENWVYDTNGNLLGRGALRNPWQTDKVIYQGYVDSCGFGTGAAAEGNSPLVPNSNDNWNNCMFVRWFAFEPAKQGNKEYNSRTTKALWTYINLNTQEKRLGNSIQYYYPDYMKQMFAPKTSSEPKDFFTNKNTFKSDKPNVINITFGIQATSDDSKGIKASRCFNWVSVGYYNEFIEYRKVGETSWNKVYSITENDSSNTTAINQFIQHYKRFRWCSSNGTWVTTHKVILSEMLTSGDYEYRVGRDGDSTYYSDILNFTVADASNVKSFVYLQTSDQQGFNWAEYQAWKKSAHCINRQETDFKFTINTGDITQSGNRENEWLDYYDGRQYIRDTEEMFTIGNNDLCGHDATKLTNGNDASSKYNHVNVLRYYTFELDTRNDYSFTWKNSVYPIYSLYSFNYGSYHFICLNSETAIASSKTYEGWEDEGAEGDRTFAELANAAIEEWLKKDLQLWQGTDEEPTNCSKAIVYMHEMPFTIVTWGFMSGTSERAGSHLNTLDSNGNYRFSRLFKKYGIRLVMGGHKHTYCITKPVYDAPADYIVNNAASASADLMGEVTPALSRIPVVQVTSSSYVRNSDFARYEVVSKLNAPTYVMAQATGYKLVSNKEQPSGNQYQIPWLLSYFKAYDNKATPTENVAQHYPMYIRYELSDTQIKVTAKQVSGVWTVNIEKNSKSYDMNNQQTSVVANAMTLSQITDEDKAAYGVSTLESYTIDL